VRESCTNDGTIFESRCDRFFATEVTDDSILLFVFATPCLARVFLVTVASARPQMTAPVTTDGEFVVHNFKFQSGESLPDVRLHYTTLGKPARDAQGRTTNAVLILHGTVGSGHQFLAPILRANYLVPDNP
jgi:homoserine O-acetyltransferase